MNGDNPMFSQRAFLSDGPAAPAPTSKATIRWRRGASVWTWTARASAAGWPSTRPANGSSGRATVPRPGWAWTSNRWASSPCTTSMLRSDKETDGVILDDTSMDLIWFYDLKISWVSVCNLWWCESILLMVQNGWKLPVKLGRNIGRWRPKVAENLALFRRWCFATYGGVAIAFHALDADGSGSLSEEEFVTVIQNSSFKGGGETKSRLEIVYICTYWSLFLYLLNGPNLGSSGWHLWYITVVCCWKMASQPLLKVMLLARGTRWTWRVATFCRNGRWIFWTIWNWICWRPMCQPLRPQNNLRQRSTRLSWDGDAFTWWIQWTSWLSSLVSSKFLV